MSDEGFPLFVLLVIGIIPSRCAENDLDILLECLFDHRAPSFFRGFKTYRAVVEAVIYRHNIGAVREYVALKARLAADGIFTSDSGHDDVGHREGKALLYHSVQEMRVCGKGVDEGCGEISRGNAVPVANNIDNPVDTVWITNPKTNEPYIMSVPYCDYDVAMDNARLSLTVECTVTQKELTQRKHSTMAVIDCILLVPVSEDNEE